MTTLARTSNVELDETELIHLALHAMGKDRHEESMRLLKRALEAFPTSARARYLLGAEHAQIGLYDRALEEMSEAVKLDPSLTVAHFQLGLLHLTAGRVREAETAWLPLERLPADDPLRLFKAGMLNLARNELTACVENLRAGIARNRLNEPLNDDMRRLLADVEKLQVGSGSARADAPPPRIEPLTRHMLLSTYDRNRDDKAKD